MSRRQQPCRNFLNGHCRFGANCRFLHDSQNQNQSNATTNLFGFGIQKQSSTPPFSQTSQQDQKPNPFGFGVQNTSPLKTNPTSAFENKWTRSSSSSERQPEAQTQSSVHICSDPETCKKVIIEDSKNEAPLWKLTCYGHAKNGPCDLSGDISFEELRTLAYEESKQGCSLQSIVERERNLLQSKLGEFDNLLRNPYVLKNGGPSTTGLPSFGASQSNAPPTLTSFSQLGAFRAPASSSPFGQSGLFQNSSQISAQPEMKFGTSVGTFGSQMTNQNQAASAFGSTQPTTNISNFAFGRPANANGNASGSQQQSLHSPSLLQSSSSNSSRNNTSKQQSASLGFGFLGASPVSSNIDAQPQDKQEKTRNDAIWLKEKWSIGEIPEEAPPAQYC